MIYQKLKVDESGDITTGQLHQRLIVELTSVEESEIEGFSCEDGENHSVHKVNDQQNTMFTFCPYLPNEDLARGLRELADSIDAFTERNGSVNV